MSHSTRLRSVLAAVGLKPASIKMGLLLLALTVSFLALTPELARKGAPFGRFSPVEIAHSSCGMHLNGYDFCDVREDVFIQSKCLCTNMNALATVSHCYQMAYPEQIEGLIDSCNRDFDAGLTRAKFDAALALYEETAEQVDSTPQQSGDSAVLQHPVKLNDTRILINKRMFDQFLGNYNRSIVFGFYLVGFWVVVLGLAAVGNWSKVLFPGLCKRITDPSTNWIRKNITLPALSGRYKTREKPFAKVLDMLVPTRAETLIMVAFTALTVFLSVYNIHYVEGDPFYNRYRALLRYYGIRTGILGSYLLPFSILFAGRNNIFQWITRWEYATFVTFHRWISRLMVLLIVVHSNSYYFLLKGYMEEKFREPLVLWGILGTYCGVAIIIQGLLVLRRKWYEAFLLLHILLAAGYMLGAWFHVKDLYFLWYYYCSVWLWISDRAIRVYRLGSFGFPEAQVKLYEDQTLKFKIRKPDGFVSEGGGHCFVHFLRWLCFWQSHPFTYIVIGDDIVFYIKVKEGVTMALSKYLAANPGKSAKMRLAVEGSYGEATPAAKYDSSVFVAGGSGIPGIYAEAVHAAKSLGVESKRKVKLIWVVRDYESLLWFYDELISLKAIPIEVEIYVTKPSDSISNSTEEGDKMALLPNTYTHAAYQSTSLSRNSVEQLKKDLEHVDFKQGRPNIAGIVSSNVKESAGSIAFVTCGHPIMVDDLRHEVVQIIGKEDKRIDFFEQLQIWA